MSKTSEGRGRPKIMLAEKFEGWFIDRSDEGYDCPDCQMSAPLRNGCNGLKAVEAPCPKHVRA